MWSKGCAGEALERAPPHRASRAAWRLDGAPDFAALRCGPRSAHVRVRVYRVYACLFLYSCARACARRPRARVSAGASCAAAYAPGRACVRVFRRLFPVRVPAVGCCLFYPVSCAVFGLVDGRPEGYGLEDLV